MNQLNFKLKELESRNLCLWLGIKHDEFVVRSHIGRVKVGKRIVSFNLGKV